MNQPQKVQRQSLSPEAQAARESAAAAEPPDPGFEAPIIGRRTRPVFGMPVLQLDASEYVREGYKGRWINDTPGRISRALKCGYEHVKDEEGKPKSEIVDKRIGTRGFLMEIPQEFYDEDFALKQAQDDEMQAALMNRPVDRAGYRDDPKSSMPANRQQVFSGRQPS